MKRAVMLFVVAALPVLLLPAPGLTDMGVNTRGDILAPVELNLTPSFVFGGAKHVANGIAMRNEARGTISLRGVPLGSTVFKAYLYWNFSDTVASGAANSAILFNGNAVSGVKVADSSDPCWGMAGNHSYRADVTMFIPVSRPNGDYEVVKSGATTSGQNPWSPTEAQTIRMEGATLIVLYKNTSTANVTVFVYDQLSGSTFSSGNGTFFLNHPTLPTGPGLYTMCGADGQRGSGFSNGHDNSASNEVGSFNGIQFSGPPVASSDWDGSAGWPLVQLWDVHTHIVELTGSVSTVVYTAPSDCLTPVLFVLQAGGI